MNQTSLFSDCWPIDLSLSKNVSHMGYFFCKCSEISYTKSHEGQRQFDEINFVDHKYINIDGNRCHLAASDKHVIVSFAGSDSTNRKQYWNNINFMFVKHRNGYVHHSFKTNFDGIVDEVVKFIRNHDTKSLWIVGHSLGGSLAVLLADYCINDSDIQNPRMIFTYGAPRTGDALFNKSVTTRHIRYEHVGDVVCDLPPAPLYQHHGEQYLLDDKGVTNNRFTIPYLIRRWYIHSKNKTKTKFNKWQFHNINVYKTTLHAIYNMDKYHSNKQ